MDFVMKMDYIMRTGGRNGGQAGLLRQLTTGNILFDTVVAAIIPVAMHLLLPRSRLTGYVWLDVAILASFPILRNRAGRIKKRIRSFASEFYAKTRNQYELTIEFEKENVLSRSPEENESAYGEEGKRNNILQRAIILYIGHMKLEYHRSLALLSAIKEKSSKEEVGPRWRSERKAVYGGTAEHLMAYKINISPPRDIWVLVDAENGVYFKQRKSVTTPGGREIGGGSNDDRRIKTTVHYTFWCKRVRGNALIQAFIDRAFKWYCEEMKATEDNSRYMYTLISEPEPPKKEGRPGPGGDDKGGKKAPAQMLLKYKRYKLGDVKDFSSLFFPEKENLLKILDYFEHKTGKYAVKGYPHKLGLLLHGPPGTGKTSLIKALACHTGRHIVTVPLGRIKTNQDLMNIMFDQSFCVLKEEFPVDLKYENIIFVFEDVDAATPIVHQRPFSEKSNKRSRKQHRRAPARRPITSATHSPPAAALHKKGAPSSPEPVAEIEQPDSHGNTSAFPRATLGTTIHIPAPVVVVSSSSAPTTTIDHLADSPTSSSASTAPVSLVEVGETPSLKGTPPQQEPQSHQAFTTAAASLAASSMPVSTADGRRGGEIGTVTGDGDSNHHARNLSQDSDLAGAEAVRVEEMPVPATVKDIVHENSLDGETVKQNHKNAPGIAVGKPTQGVTAGADSRGSGGGGGSSAYAGDEYSSFESRSEEASSSSDEDDDDDDDDDDGSGLEDDDDGDDGGDGGDGGKKRSKGGGSSKVSKKKAKKKYASKYDKLDLAGLLNVLDGVVDTPGRIVIMTTNHIDTLDSALIRPGRIDKRIRLGYMQYPAALEMTRHFFQASLTTEQQARLEAIFDDERGVALRRSFDRSRDQGRLTPAVIEQMAGEYDTVDEFLAALEELPGAFRKQLERKRRNFYA